MSNLSKVEEVALGFLNASIVGGKRFDINTIYEKAEEFLRASPSYKKPYETGEDFRERVADTMDKTIKEIEVIDSEEVIHYGIHSPIVSPANIMDCLEKVEDEIQDRKIISPIAAMELANKRLAQMSAALVSKANAK